ncbi:hypothetical protein GCM10023201_12660 [Actinomycetospora corticicola]|uniref:Uncharacterized protein n=1 Tax=Actinomycetospora corticicola TaxID=663602 RepID=A0A7Y9DZM6_9PSEU|nr:DUF6474 family protein [Actinomycetospora corticicola]NYD38414.1 hypothetical protein [Actinomycetospora corticicola]
MARRTSHTVELEGGDGVVIWSRKAAKHAAKAEKHAGRAAKADRLAAERRAEAAEAEKARAAEDTHLTGATVKRWIGIARIVVPIAAPLIYQAVGAARSALDEQRARRFGVAPDELSSFSGRGTGLYARAHSIATSIREIERRREGDADVRAFARDARDRLSDLEAAVRSAEQMPTARRRRAHVAVAEELDRLEARLLELWGLDGTPGLPAGGS